MTFNQSQLKLLANFCSDIAKGALLSGLGFSYIITGSLVERTTLFAGGIAMSGIMLYLALLATQTIKE